MVEPLRKRVFISYARKDAACLAIVLHQSLQSDHDVWLDTNRLVGGASWTVEIERAVDNCDILLALLTSGSYVSDICRAEQLRALRRGKRVIPLLAEAGADRPLHLETANYRDFTASPPGQDQLRQLREDIRTGRDAAMLPKKFSKTYVTAPPLPRNYVERPDALASLKSAVIRDEPGKSVALTALRGMGGIGKTILAQALSHDDAVQQAFPDGIAWITVGKDLAQNLTARMQRVRRALGEEPGAAETEEQCIDLYRTLIRERQALVIVDDVWRTTDIEPFLAESARSQLLFTTRDSAIAAATGAVEYLADLLTPEQSLALLSRWAGHAPEALPPEAADLVAECGRLPLALSVIGAMLRGKPAVYWGHVLELLRGADLSKIRAQLPFYPYTDMLRAIQVSVDALESEARRRYVALAVLLDDMPAVPAVQQTIWGVDASEALETAEQFVRLSLAQRDSDGGGIHLHDMQLDYVRREYPDRAALDLIHGGLRLSAHVIERDPTQFVSQVIGRLLPYRDTPGIGRFMGEIAGVASCPWLRPLHPALHPPGTELELTLRGHSNLIEGVVVTSDGQRVVSASTDKTLKVWDLKTGRTLRTLEGHSTCCFYDVAVTPDGRRAVSASTDRALRVWDLESGRPLRTLEGHSHYVTGVAVTPDGRRAVSASRDCTLKVWSLDYGGALRTLEGHANWVTAVAVTPDGERAVSASEDHTLMVWDLETGRPLLTLEGHSSSVAGVAVTPDGQRAVSASTDRTLKVWSLQTGRALRTLEGHSDWVNGVAVTPDGRRVVSASRDKALKVWDLETGRALLTLEGHFYGVNCVAVTSDGRRAISASDDETLKVWRLDLDSRRPLDALESHSSSVCGVVATLDGRRAVSASWDQTLKVWDTETGRVLRILEGHSNWVDDVAVTPDGRQAISASRDHTLMIWDLETGRTLRTLEGHSMEVNCVAVTPDGRRAVSASWDHTLRLWDLETGCALRTLKGHLDCVYGVAVVPDGQQVVSASLDKTLKVWDLTSGHVLRTLEGHSYGVYDVAVTPDGRQAISASADHTLKIWDLETGRSLRTLEGHSDGVNCVAVTPDGRRAISASTDHTLKVWDLESALPLATFHCDAVARCCALAGNDLIVAGDDAGHLYFLRLIERS